MRSQFDQQLEVLHNEMLNMGELSDEAMDVAIESLLNGDIKRAKDINNMMTSITQQERSIENICLKLLMQQQPVARDLRTISSSLKMVTDMERIGIQATEIAEIISVGNIKPGMDMTDFKQISEAVSKMVHLSLEAFAKKDLEAAQDVIRYDDMVDELFCKIKNNIISQFKTDGSNPEYLIDMLMIDKYFERIADHAVNIAKWIIFSVNGEITIIE